MQQPPKKPGVYFFQSSKNEVLYVGKSINLHNRILSYRRKDQLQAKTELMLKQAAKLKFLQLDTNFDAVILEAELIKTHQPKYNLRLKDDKSQIYIVTTDEKYPRVITRRKTSLKELFKYQDIFGPYQSAREAKKVLKSLRRIFPFCNKKNKSSNNKPCFYFHIDLCAGACTRDISVKEYKYIIKNLKTYLKGKKNMVLKDVEKKMHQASNKQNYELAAKLRDIYRSINNLSSEVSLNFLDTFEDLSQTKTDILKQLWKILSPFESKSKIKIPQKIYSRIEAYDVSNISGKQATASMVVFIEGLPEKNQYRRFRIKYSEEPNDILMLSEAVLRRLSHRDWSFPDLILVDGGKTQVRAVKKVLASKGLHHKIMLIGLAKKYEEIIIHKHGFHSLKLNKYSPVLLLLKHIRDEAHRFAKKYHLYLRNKNFLNVS